MALKPDKTILLLKIFKGKDSFVKKRGKKGDNNFFYLGFIFCEDMLDEVRRGGSRGLLFYSLYK